MDKEAAAEMRDGKHLSLALSSQKSGSLHTVGRSAGRGTGGFLQIISEHCVYSYTRFSSFACRYSLTETQWFFF